MKVKGKRLNAYIEVGEHGHLEVRDIDTDELLVGEDWREVKTKFNLCNRCLVKEHMGIYNKELNEFQCEYYAGLECFKCPKYLTAEHPACEKECDY